MNPGYLKLQELEKIINPLEKTNEEAAKKAYDEVISLLSFPKKILEDDSKYEEIHTKLFNESNLFESLGLTYDRESYNNSLINALQHAGIKISTGSLPSLFNTKENNLSTLSKDSIKYLDAIEAIFTTFNKITTEKLKDQQDIMGEPIDYSLKMIEKIHSFLNNVSFCVVQTGDEKDAYLLFEVLNDRSLALNDLDLIKNQFYKNFVLKNKETSDITIDETIQLIDDQWVNKIFPETDPASLKNLVSYIAITYITGDNKLKSTDGSSYRESIQRHLASMEVYSIEDIKRHFNIFETCRILLRETLNLKFHKAESEALFKEYSAESTIFHKTAFFLHAKKQHGVLSGLTNFVLRYYEDIINNFEPDSMRIKLKELNKACPNEIKNQSHLLWKASMLAKDEIAPRKLAQEIIKLNYLNSPHTHTIDISETILEDLKQEFSNWLSSWSYNKNDFKVRVLFAKFIGLDIDDNNKLVKKHARLAISEDKIRDLQLDHIEPQSIDQNNLDSYFTNESRDTIVNSLGNLMPLTAELNREKSNQPISAGLQYFKDFGIENHILYKSIETFLDGKKVPDEDFFIDRSKWLQSIFKDLVNFAPDK